MKISTFTDYYHNLPKWERIERMIYFIVGLYFFFCILNIVQNPFDERVLLKIVGLADYQSPSLRTPIYFLAVFSGLFAIFVIQIVLYVKGVFTREIPTIQMNLLSKIISLLKKGIESSYVAMSKVMLGFMIAAIFHVIFSATGLFVCVTESIPGGIATSCPPQQQIVNLLIFSVFTAWAFAPKNFMIKKPRVFLN